jgi:hypothetical protein
VLLIGVSEPLSPTRVSNATVTLAANGHAAVAVSATFVGSANQIVLTPRVALAVGEYNVTVTTGLADMAGNTLVALRTFRFTVGAPVTEQRVFLPTVLK